MAVMDRGPDVVHPELQSADVGVVGRLRPGHRPDHQRTRSAVLLHVRQQRLQRLRIHSPSTQPVAPPQTQVVAMATDDVIDP